MEDNLLKTLKATFTSLNSFINEVQDMGCIERSFLSYSIASNIENRSLILSYYISLKKLLEDLQDNLNILQNLCQVANSDLTMHCNIEGTSHEKETIEHNVEQNILDESFVSDSHYIKINKYRSHVSLSTCKDLNHNPSGDSFLKSTIYSHDNESSKQFSHLLSFQETASLSNSLVVPFENMALNTTLQPTSVCHNTLKQTIPEGIVLPYTTYLSDIPSTVYAPQISYHTSHAINSQAPHSHITSLNCEDVSNAIKSDLKSDSSGNPSKNLCDPSMEECSSDIKSIAMNIRTKVLSSLTSAAATSAITERSLICLSSVARHATPPPAHTLISRFICADSLMKKLRRIKVYQTES